MVVFLTAVYLTIFIVGISSHGLVSGVEFLLSEAVLLAISYAIYKRRKNLQEYPFWTCYVVAAIVGVVLTAVFARMGVIAIILGIVTRLGILFFNFPISFVHAIDERFKSRLIRSAFVVLAIGGLLFGLSMLYPITSSEVYYEGKQYVYSPGPTDYYNSDRPFHKQTDVYKERETVQYIQTTLRALAIIGATGIVVLLLPRKKQI